MARPPDRTATGLWDRLRGALSRREPVREPAARPRRDPPAAPRDVPNVDTDPRERGLGGLPERPDDQPAGPRPEPADAGRAPLYDGRPRVLIRGVTDVSTRLTDFRVEERVNRPMRCTMGFSTSPEALLNGGSVLFGDEVEILIGDPEVRLFKGNVFSIGLGRRDGGDRRTEIVACDRLVRLEYTRRTRSFFDTDIESILLSIASEHALEPEVSVDAPTMRQQMQANENDLEFARRMVEAVGAEIWVDDDEFFAAAWHDRPGVTINVDAGVAFDAFWVAADLEGQRASVDVRGWNTLQGETLASDADAVSGPPHPGITAAQVLQQVGLSSEPVPIVHTGAEDAAEAAVRAAARFSAVARRFSVLKGGMSGNPKVRIGAALLVDGITDAFEGRYRVDGTVHVYTTADGYRTSIEASRPVYEGR